MTATSMEHLSAVLSDISERLVRLERKIDEAAQPPRAVPILEAARLLSVGETKMRQLLAQKKIRTVPIGDSDMVPMSEIVRVTSVTTTPRTAPTIPVPKRMVRAGSAGAADREVEKLREIRRKRRSR